MKTPTKLLCQKCLKKKPPIRTFISKQDWGKGNGQHFRLTCDVCGWSEMVNKQSLEIMEEEK